MFANFTLLCGDTVSSWFMSSGLMMKRVYIYGLFVLACCAMSFGAAQADELPQWEAGAGAVLFSMPDYRGSDHSEIYAYPIPYLVYRGDVLRIDRKAIRGVFYTSDRIEVDTSINGTPSISSDGNAARQGMPDLDANIEIGPSLKIRLDNGGATGLRTELQLPLRASFATDLTYLHYTGLVFYPRLNVDWTQRTAGGRWSAGAALGPVFIDTRNAEWFYSVAPQYANMLRSQYDAAGGYAGMQLALAATVKTNGYWLGVFSRVDSVSGARFEDSPLVTAKWNVTVGIAAAWVFGTSEVKVKSEEW